MKQGHIIVVSGASGVGKGTVCRALAKRLPNLHISISATTREPRLHEENGVQYYFVTKQRFEEMIAQNELLEYACYVDNYYGTPVAPVDRQLNAGQDVLLEIDVKGALKVKQARPDALLIFITAPSFAELERRLCGRGDTEPGKIEKRLATARLEYKIARQYDYIVVNDTVEHACDEIAAILAAHKCQTKYRTDYLKEEP